MLPNNGFLPNKALLRRRGQRGNVYQADHLEKWNRQAPADTHAAIEDDVRFVEPLEVILRHAPTKENGSGLERPEPSCLN
jgi:hypothetical protein